MAFPILSVYPANVFRPHLVHVILIPANAFLTNNYHHSL
jgi:hypothetical protein